MMCRVVFSHSSESFFDVVRCTVVDAAKRWNPAGLLPPQNVPVVSGSKRNTCAKVQVQVRGACHVILPEVWETRKHGFRGGSG